MRPLYFLLPGTQGRYRCGGLFAELNTLELARQLCAAEVVTYQQREPDTLFLDDVLQQPGDEIFVVSWGFHVPKLLRRLRQRPVIYHAHSTGYGFPLPPAVPVIAVSRNSLGYWGQLAPSNLLYHLPNVIGEEFHNRQQPRDIDVLVQARKSSRYVLQQLVPTLGCRCRVQVVDSFVEDLAGLFNRTRIYLYDSAEYWATSRLSEGFGLPPMEAMACGAQVFSSVNGALADYLDPGFNCYKIGCYDTAYDVERILAALQLPPRSLDAAVLAAHRREAVLGRLEVMLGEINGFCDRISHYPGDIPALTPSRLARYRLQQLAKKVRRKLRR